MPKLLILTLRTKRTNLALWKDSFCWILRLRLFCNKKKKLTTKWQLSQRFNAFHAGNYVSSFITKGSACLWTKEHVVFISTGKDRERQRSLAHVFAVAQRDRYRARRCKACSIAQAVLPSVWCRRCCLEGMAYTSVTNCHMPCGIVVVLCASN